jgi:hypothetical protein
MKAALILLALIILGKEIRISIASSALADVVGTQDLTAINQTWNQYEGLTDGSLQIGGRPLERALVNRTTVLAESVIARYKDSSVIVWESQWRQARDALVHSLRNRSSRSREAALRYCEGQLRRIDGEARTAELRAAAARGDSRKGGEDKGPAAQRELTAAVTAFREAAELRPDWPDPFLGLMRTFVALDDIERAADALAQAQRYGYAADRRDWFHLGDGYLARGNRLASVKELDSLMRAADAYARAIELYDKALGYRGAGQRMRDAQRQLQQVEEEIHTRSATSPTPEGPGGTE